LKGVENIGIDEFAVKKGHVYKTIVVDLDTRRIIYARDAALAVVSGWEVELHTSVTTTL
jgi:hypothetical protein